MRYKLHSQSSISSFEQINANLLVCNYFKPKLTFFKWLEMNNDRVVLWLSLFFFSLNRNNCGLVPLLVKIYVPCGWRVKSERPIRCISFSGQREWLWKQCVHWKCFYTARSTFSLLCDLPYKKVVLVSKNQIPLCLPILIEN